MKPKHHFQKVARLPHFAQFDLCRNLMINDGHNRLDNLDKAVCREVVLNVLCEDSTFSLAAVCKFVNKAVN